MPFLIFFLSTSDTKFIFSFISSAFNQPSKHNPRFLPPLSLLLSQPNGSLDLSSRCKSQIAVIRVHENVNERLIYWPVVVIHVICPTYHVLIHCIEKYITKMVRWLRNLIVTACMPQQQLYLIKWERTNKQNCGAWIRLKIK